MEERDLAQRQEEELTRYESLCRCCGVCCGAKDNDPCIHLKEHGPDKYYCEIYHNRFGVQKTVTGKEFTCVMIRDVINFGVRYEGCGYNV